MNPIQIKIIVQGGVVHEIKVFHEDANVEIEVIDLDVEEEDEE